MSLLNNARLAVRRLGVDVRRWPDPAQIEPRLVTLLRHNHVSTVIDVGANVGDYGAALREHGFAGAIFSFEPVDAQWSHLQQRASRDPLWSPLRYACGDRADEVSINVAANTGASSSILPMLSRHAEAAPNASYVHTETVPQCRLDEMMPKLGVDAGKVLFLKLDVQGYEEQVLDGAAGVLDQVAGIQIEMSLVPLYEGAMGYTDVLDWMRRFGYSLNLVVPGFWDQRTGQQLQVDGVFFRGE